LETNSCRALETKRTGGVSSEEKKERAEIE
jgi:hypothetical protein